MVAAVVAFLVSGLGCIAVLLESLTYLVRGALGLSGPGAFGWISDGSCLTVFPVIRHRLETDMLVFPLLLPEGGTLDFGSLEACWTPNDCFLAVFSVSGAGSECDAPRCLPVLPSGATRTLGSLDAD